MPENQVLKPFHETIGAAIAFAAIGLHTRTRGSNTDGLMALFSLLGQTKVPDDKVDGVIDEIKSVPQIAREQGFDTHATVFEAVIESLHNRKKSEPTPATEAPTTTG